MTRRSLLSALLALMLPKPPAPRRYLFRLVSIEIPDDLWTKKVVYKITRPWAFESGSISWTFR